MVGLKLAVLLVTLFYMVQNIFLNQVPIIETKKVEAKKLVLYDLHLQQHGIERVILKQL